MKVTMTINITSLEELMRYGEEHYVDCTENEIVGLVTDALQVGRLIPIIKFIRCLNPSLCLLDAKTVMDSMKALLVQMTQGLGVHRSEMEIKLAIERKVASLLRVVNHGDTLFGYGKQSE